MRFGIRDLIWVTLVAAMGLAWWVSYTAAAREHDRLMVLCMEQEMDLLREENILLNRPDPDVKLLRKWAMERLGKREARRANPEFPWLPELWWKQYRYPPD
jgi:hypothetical protein